MLPTLYGIFRTYALEIINSAINDVEGAFVELKTKNFIGILRERFRVIQGIKFALANHYSACRDESAQASCLHIVYNLRSKLDAAQVLFFIPSVCDIINHSSPICRREMYKIMMWAYDTYR